MSIFEKIFNNILIQEITTWNQGTLTELKPTQRHRKVIKDPGFRKHAQTVPDMHKVDPKSIQAMNDLRTSNTNRKALSQDEIQKICTKYGISRVNPNTPKSLGNTGILLKFDHNLGGYILQK